MRSQIKKAFTAFVLLILLVGCAQVVPLSGGKKDTTPPRLIESSPANFTKNFIGKTIVLVFDEYVQVRDLPNQLVVSPHLKTEPLVNAEGKKIVIEVDPKELQLNTTYRFAFGKSISDMNESNPYENFEFVFSTGPAIDSLQVRGKVTDAFTARRAPGIAVGLYKNAPVSDSLPYLVRPDYVALTNESGEFLFKNLPAATFRLFAISDRNKNKVYDPETEKIGFRNDALNLIADTNLALNIFQEEPSRTFIRKTVSAQYGLSQIILNKKSLVKIRTLKGTKERDISEINPGIEKDTISFFYRNVNDSLDLSLQNLSSGKIDTLHLVLPRNNRNKRFFSGMNFNTQGNILPLHQKLQVKFNSWMDTSKVNYRRIKINRVQDSITKKDSVRGHWLDLSTYQLDMVLKEASDYIMRIDTGSFFDIYGASNDSVNLNFKTRSRLEFGKLTLKVSLNKKRAYIVQLVTDQMQVVAERKISFSLSSSNTVSLDFIDLPPGVYQARFIFDDNENGKWDTGNASRNKQPETILMSSKLLKVLADWEIEEEIIEKDPGSL